MNVLFVAVGVAGIGWILNDIFKQVLVPRAVEGNFRISVFYARIAWTTFRRIAAGIRKPGQREDFLGFFAPLYFVTLLGLWLAALMLGYGLVLYGLRDQIHPVPTDFGSTLYFAANSVLTIGFGDYVATEGPARAVAVIAGASGIGTVAVAIAFLFAIIGAFQQRERFVVILDARAGAPPSGVALLETYAALGMIGDLPSLFRESEIWVADVLDSHLAYPILIAFRSSHKDESWVAALGALLDAAALACTVVKDLPVGAARLFLDVGNHLTHDFASYFTLPDVPDQRTTAAQRQEVIARLRGAGLHIDDDGEAWARFDELREGYSRPLAGIGARWLHATSQLLGERTALPGHL